jgi:hypothetical protein
MDFDKIFFLTGLLLPFALFVFGREIMIQKKYRPFLISTVASIAVFGIVFALMDYNENHFSLLLVNPFISYLLFLELFKSFDKKFNRIPIDPTVSRKSRLINIAYFFLAATVPFFFILGVILLINSS